MRKWDEDYLKLVVRAIGFLDRDAMHNLGACYGAGDITEVFLEEARREAALWYRIAGFLGHAESQYDFGFMVLDGELPEVDRRIGKAWIRKAADKGFEPAQRLIAELES